MADEISEKDLADLKIEENDEESTNYKAPAKKTISELNDLDAEDESLRKYKEVSSSYSLVMSFWTYIKVYYKRHFWVLVVLVVVMPRGL